MSAHAAKLPVCPNCQTDLSRGENFCPTCGQPNHDVNVTFGHVVEETLEGVFHFDSKVWLTFRELVFQPGKLTVDYLAGRRARFVPPIRLYVLVALVFFFLVGKEADHASHDADSAIRFRAKSHAAAARAPGADPESLGEALAAVRDSVRQRRGHDAAVINFEGDSIGGLSSGDLADQALMARLADGDNTFVDSLIRARGGQPTFLKRLTYRQTGRLNTRQEALMHSLVKNLSLGMFWLMPVFALLLKVFYRRQRPFYVQHLLFSISLHTFFFLFLSVLLVVSFALPAGREIPAPLVMVPLWIYWVLALRRFSGQTYRRTLWKGSLLFAGYVGILLVFTVGVLVTSLALF